MELNKLLQSMDLSYFGTGSHKITFEKAMELFKEDKSFILDVRTKEEQEYVVLPFTTNIPLNELPNNLNKLPKEKVIAIYCTTCTRATVAYTYLLSLGYNAKVLPEHLSDFVGHFKPGYVRKNPLK